MDISSVHCPGLSRLFIAPGVSKREVLKNPISFLDMPGHFYLRMLRPGNQTLPGREQERREG